MQRLLGVLGGMGPLATVDFFRKVVEETQATVDQEHIPLIIDSVPQIPCRVAAVLREGESPVPQMLSGIMRLKKAGAECIAIACNTAHYWYDDLCEQGGMPILHIVDAVATELERTARADAPLGLLATEATLEARIYQSRLAQREIDFIINTPEERAELILPAIALVKQGKPQQGGELLDHALGLLQERGAGQYVLACTELPVAVDAVSSLHRAHCIDATRALAKASVRWSLQT
jgi:aspartate racemase